MNEDRKKSAKQVIGPRASRSAGQGPRQYCRGIDSPERWGDAMRHTISSREVSRQWRFPERATLQTALPLSILFGRPSSLPAPTQGGYGEFMSPTAVPESRPVWRRPWARHSWPVHPCGSLGPPNNCRQFARQSTLRRPAALRMHASVPQFGEPLSLLVYSLHC